MDPSQRFNQDADSVAPEVSSKPITRKTDVACIDLPGEQVRCWRESDQLTVVLRKHRDIILDIRTEPGASYTIESTNAPIYCDRIKKLLMPKTPSPTFADGERFHIWISRELGGTIVLRKNGNFLMEFEPHRFDSKKYKADPKTKPDPIIISLGATTVTMPSLQLRPQAKTPEASPSAHADGEFPIICVLDRMLKDAPPAILRYLANGGGESGLVDFDPFDVVTRNWIFGQVAGSAAYVKDNWEC